MNISFIFGLLARPCTFESSSGEVRHKMNACIFPLRYKNKMYIYGVNTEIGYNPEGYYKYIGPADADITDYGEGDFIRCGGEKYRIDRAEKEYMGTEGLYIWAVIRKIVELQEDESNE